MGDPLATIQKRLGEMEEAQKKAESLLPWNTPMSIWRSVDTDLPLLIKALREDLEQRKLAMGRLVCMEHRVPPVSVPIIRGRCYCESCRVYRILDEGLSRLAAILEKGE